MKKRTIDVTEISWKEAQDIMMDCLDPCNLNVESLLYDAISQLFDAQADDINNNYYVVDENGRKAHTANEDLPFFDDNDSAKGTVWTDENSGNYPDFREQYFEKAYQTIKDYLNNALPNH